MLVYFSIFCNQIYNVCRPIDRLSMCYCEFGFEFGMTLNDSKTLNVFSSRIDGTDVELPLAHIYITRKEQYKFVY